MTKFIPYQINYSWLKITGAFSNCLIYCSAIISIVLLAMEVITISCDTTVIKHFLNCCLAWISVVYFGNEMVQSFIFHKAEALRNLDFIDNSLNSKFSEKNSEGYYSNDILQKGIYKMGVNGFENSFFTKSVTGKMLQREIIKLIIVSLLLLSVSLFSSSKVVTMIFQLALPLVIIQQTIKLYSLNSKVSEIFFNYKSIFTSTKPVNMTSNIIKNVINYEKNLSWAGISLDSDVFNKMNDELSAEWNVIKQNHNIK